MTYTYDDFLKAANSEGMMDQFSDEDLKLAQTHPEFGISMLSLLKDSANATSDDAKLLATEAMKQLRSNYAPAPAQPAGSFQYDNEAAYREALDSVVNGKPFQYNHETDPAYQAFAKTYRREGQRATEDTLARVAAASGGSVPTSAVTAATQAGDYYAAQLADKLPQLRQQAYTDYANEEALKQARLNVLAADRQQKQNDWQLNYNLQQTERDRLMQLMTGFGYTPTAEELAAAGMSDAEVQLYMNYYKNATSGGGKRISSTVINNLTKARQNGQNVFELIDLYRMTGDLDDESGVALARYYLDDMANNAKNTVTAPVQQALNKTINSVGSIFKK